PFWKRWWFLSGVILLFAGMVGGTLRYYELQKMKRAMQALEREQAIRKEREETRDRIVRDLHDDISATLSGISFFAQAIEGEKKSGNLSGVDKFLSLIQTSAATVQETMSDIVWSINPDHDRWETILAKFRRYASDILDSKNINYEMNIQETLAVRELAMEERKSLWLIYKELVTNIARHSDASNVKIELRADEPSLLRLEISDNGKGFDPTQPTERHGVKNIYVRAKQIRAEVTLNTSAGKGTRWILTFPI
ncbi:MAG: hypothetical protein HYZ34_04680, partial [Ignavibacteriae bacterium]|nr:hypothetical protein [Ignavibacteriota bacterium]